MPDDATVLHLLERVPEALGRRLDHFLLAGTELCVMLVQRLGPSLKEARDAAVGVCLTSPRRHVPVNRTESKTLFLGWAWAWQPQKLQTACALWLSQKKRGKAATPKTAHSPEAVLARHLLLLVIFILLRLGCLGILLERVRIRVSQQPNLSSNAKGPICPSNMCWRG